MALKCSYVCFSALMIAFSAVTAPVLAQEVSASAAALDASGQLSAAAADATAAAVTSSGTTDPAILSTLAPPVALQQAPIPADGLAAAAAAAAAAVGAHDVQIGTPTLTRHRRRARRAAPADPASTAAAADAAAAAAAAGVAGGGGGDFTTQGVTLPATTAGVAAHNAYRWAKHQVPDLKESTTLQTAALIRALDLFASCNVSGVAAQSGENLYSQNTTGQTLDDATLVTNAVNAWYNQSVNYNYTNPPTQNDAYFQSVGAFTQVVWKVTTDMGCWVVPCTNIAANASGAVVVCKYSPAGNVLGMFADNVLPPSAPIPEVNPTTIAEGTVLNETSCWKSQNNAFWFCLEADGKVNHYKRTTTTNTTVWTNDMIGSKSRFYQMTLLGASAGANRGKLRVTSGTSTIWSSPTANNATASTPNRLQILNNGNVALVNSTGGVYWSTNTAGA